MHTVPSRLRAFSSRLTAPLPFLVLLALLSAPQQGSSSGILLVAGVAVTSAAIMMAARYAALAVRPPGAASWLWWSHQQLMRAEPEPEHPDTAGRPRTRAPSRPFPAA